MKGFFLVLSLLLAAPAIYSLGLDNPDHAAHQDLKPYIHPEVLEAIAINENKVTGPHAADGDQPEPTGFNPTSDFYRGAKYINIKADAGLVSEFAANGGLDYRTFSHSPVRGQIQGSCWAEGAVSAFELNWNAVVPGKKVFSVNDVIDCSGFGTARGGGQLSLEYALGGLAYESDYRYTGRDGKCRKDVERHNPLLQVALLRGEDGGFPTEPELITALIKYGAMEVCGSASSLGRGGRQDTIRSGITNHCYAYGSAVPGKQKGWLDKWYHGIKNSWGDGTVSALNLSENNWGDGGWGDYVLSKDGVKISGSVITEIMIGFAGDRVPPAPIVFFLETPGVNLKVTLMPEARGWTVKSLTEAINVILKELEQA